MRGHAVTQRAVTAAFDLIRERLARLEDLADYCIIRRMRTLARLSPLPMRSRPLWCDHLLIFISRDERYVRTSCYCLNTEMEHVEHILEHFFHP